MNPRNDTRESETKLKLNRSEEKFHILFDYSPIGMGLVAHKSGEFIEVNKSLEESTGYTRDELLKMSYWDITPNEYDSLQDTFIKELNETGRFGPYVKEYIRKDRTRYRVRIR